jgi:streptogramin lyase
LGHGFVRDVDGAITTFDPVGSAATEPFVIDDKGRITGDFKDSKGVFHGFLRKADGTIKVFDVPGATWTFPRGIDGTASGGITGSYTDTKGVYHGFLRTQ